MTGGFRKLQQQVPTAAAVAKEAMQRRAEIAAEASLGWGDIMVLDFTPDQPDVPEATRAIVRFGLEAVLARMHFAQWFSEAVVECRYREFRAVPVKVAYLENIAATWSLGGTLTLSLAFDEFWGGPFERNSFALLHELAHHEAFHHGRSFPKEVEAYAGAAAEVMLARGNEAKRLFPRLLASRPGEETAALVEPVPDSPHHDDMDRAHRSRPSWVRRLRRMIQGGRREGDQQGCPP